VTFSSFWPIAGGAGNYGNEPNQSRVGPDGHSEQPNDTDTEPEETERDVGSTILSIQQMGIRIA
jgi:hypothetical protein